MFFFADAAAQEELRSDPALPVVRRIQLRT
jgi:hypothetical protein